MATLAEIRAKLKEQESRQGGNTSGGDNGIYPFWNMAEGTTASLRFLPDGDNNNTFFWRERLMIKLPFAGVKGETDSKPVQVQIPCMEMYGESCAILNEVRGWFKDSSLEEMGRRYWKKRSYLFQGFVTDDPLKEESVPENPIRRFIIGPQIFQIIKQALMDPDMEELPTDYTSGIDFRLNKTSKGGFADYSTSNWARRERPLNDKEMHAINSFGLFNLNDFLPKKPTDVEVKIMQQMFEASVDGEAYDSEKWSQYFRPAGMSAMTGDPNTSANSTPTTTTVVETKEETVTVSEPVVAETSAGGDNAKDILAMIRARQAD
tara:strand:- start:905 stop:1864 length:960 start_codon:yes stop_codon:yes gene_type:complete